MGKFKVQVVNCYSLTVRTGGSTSFPAKAWVQVNQTFTSSSQASTGWYYLDEKGGYASNKYLKVIQDLNPPPTPPAPVPVPPPPGKFKVGDVVTLRTAATNYADGAAIPSSNIGQKFTITAVKQFVKSYSNYAYQFSGISGQWILEQDIVEYVAAKIPDPPKPVPPAIDYAAISAALQKDTLNTGWEKLKPLDPDGVYKAITLAPDVADLSWSSITIPADTAPIGPVVPIDNLKTFGSKDFDVTIADYTLNYDFIRTNLDIIRRNYNIVGETGYKNIADNLFKRFNRFKIAFPDDQLGKTFSHVFFTRPSLNLLTTKGDALNSQFANDPLFGYLYKNNKSLIQALTTHLSSTHDFHPFLSNAASSFELTDEYIKTIEIGETFTGWKVQYGRHNIESNTAGQFAVHYTDDAYFNIYKTHKAWTEYISRVYRGAASPDRENIKKKILDYAASVYYFICAADGETILFWSKYYGVFPLNAPASAGSWNKGNEVKLPDFNINYAYAIKEDVNPITLAEFNMNSSADFVYKKIYESVLASTGRTLSGAPFIAEATDNYGNTIYKLKFRD
jgi:hypothetical protein